MGGEDWVLWVDALQDAGVLSSNFKTVAYTYLGNELTWPIYRGGTLGKAKEDLDRARDEINRNHGKSGVEAMIAVLKAVVTQAMHCNSRSSTLFLDTLQGDERARDTRRLHSPHVSNVQ